MEFVYCEGMSNAQPSINNFKIKESTVIKKGDVISLDMYGDAVKAESTSLTIGIAAEDHPASDNSELLQTRKDVIKVITSSNAVYRAYANKINFKDNSTEKKLYPINCVDDAGAYDRAILMLISKSEESQNTDNIGDIRVVTSSFMENYEYIMNVTAGGIPHPDDVYAVLPYVGSSNIISGINGEDFYFNYTKGHFRCIGIDFSRNNAKGLPSCYLKLNTHVAISDKYE